MNRKDKTTGRQRAGEAVSKPRRVVIRKLPSGIPGLDDIMGGGLPEFSFTIVAGGPGCGKTTMAHQFVFANATAQRPALYFTILGESPIKMLRYQQQYSFFDPAKLNGTIRFINLSQVVLEKDLSEILNEITKEVEATNPSIVVVDSFRTALRKKSDATEMEVQFFVQQLALHLTSWEATTFLIGEYVEAEVRENPVFTVADGVFWLSQVAERNSVVRKLQVIKLRGQASMPGLHTFRITDAGLQTFPRTLGLTERKGQPARRPRLSIGIPALDEMMGGGIPLGDSIFIAGASGTGKSALGTHFIAAGLRHGEPGVTALFEERPEDYLRRAKNLGQDLRKNTPKYGVSISHSLREWFNDTIAPAITKFLQKVYDMLLAGLIVAINRGAEISHRLMPVMMADFLFEIFPGRLLGILLRGVFRKGEHFDPGLRGQPLFDFFTGVMRGLILP